MVADVLVPVGHHRAAPVPAPLADDVHLRGEKGVRISNDRADVEIMLPILDRNVEGMPAPIEVGNDGLTAPVSIAIDHVPAVAVCQKLRIEMGVARPGCRMGTHADLFRISVGHLDNPEWTGAGSHGENIPGRYRAGPSSVQAQGTVRLGSESSGQARSRSGIPTTEPTTDAVMNPPTRANMAPATR